MLHTISKAFSFLNTQDGGKSSSTLVVTAYYIIVKELHGAASRTAFCNVKL